MKKKYILIVIIIILGIGAILLLNFNTSKISPPKSTSSAVTIPSNPLSQLFEEVKFSAADGYKISGSFYPSSSKQKSKTVILVHQFGSNRHDFDILIPELLNSGFTVLDYDIRGMGKSQNGPTQINDFPKDVIGAVNFLKTKAEVDPDKIAIIGASVGANVAYVVSGSVPDIKAAISLSPSNTGSRGVLLGLDIPNFSPHNIFIASDEKEKADADFVFSLSKEIKQQKVYPGFGHGVVLLKSKEARRDILDFLKKILAV